MKINEVNEIIGCGEFEKLIGCVENEWFECKKAPYFLANPKHKQELAKDIAGIANAAGGIILLGVKTEHNEIHHGDEVVEIRCFKQDLINPNDYFNVINTWIYPAILNLEIKWFKSATDEFNGIVGILIPEQPESLRPFLLTRVFDENQKLKEISFGYCERKRDNVESFNVQRLHSILKDGLRFEELSQRIDSIETTLHKVLDSEINNNQTIEEIEKKTNNSIENLLLSADLIEKPYFVLAFSPLNSVTIKGIFEGRDSDVVKLIDQPPQLRYAGFDLDTGQFTKIIEGKYRRSLENKIKAIGLWKDGTIIFTANAGPDFLSWGNYDIQAILRINDFAIIEVCYLFCLLVKYLLPFYSPTPEEFFAKIQLKNLPTEVKPCLILGTQGLFRTTAYKAPNQNGEFSLQIKSSEFSPEISAFQLVSRVYEWFGVEHNKIPFSERHEDKYQINPEAIKNLK